MTNAALADELVRFLPVEAAGRLSSRLTENDVATLRDIVKAATPENTIRAIASDLAYLEAWSKAVRGEALSWPPTDEDGLRFIAHHLFVIPQDSQGEARGMPRAAEHCLRAGGILRGALPHAPATVRRRISSWKRVAQVRGHQDALSSPAIRQTLAAATKASAKPKDRKAKTPIVRSLLDQIVGEDGDLPNGKLSLRELRDRTILLVAFGTGGRRRSEMGQLLIENVSKLSSNEGYGIHLGRTKTTKAQDGQKLIVRGRAAGYLKTWMAALGEKLSEQGLKQRGALFRRIDRNGFVSTRGLTGAAVNAILKRKAKSAGLDPKEISAHGLRSGYLTQARKSRVPLEDAMHHSRHRSVQSAVRYYDDWEAEEGEAAKLAG
ncbi:MAG: tyrosine-type recombinase/integrase [Parvularcula sp.]|jgi:site-specific recombinase XerD|nr:tyrosine-type recombinase/integrase [Parvularcula sp.]